MPCEIWRKFQLKDSVQVVEAQQAFVFKEKIYHLSFHWNYLEGVGVRSY